MKSIHSLSFIFAALFLSSSVWAESKIAVPDFELVDLTLKLSDPKKVAEINAKEQDKLALLATLFRKGIEDNEAWSLIAVSPEARAAADVSVGYLFDCAECAAKLGRDHGADYIIIGRLHKPTYLFSYVFLHVFDVKENRMIKEYKAEVKGKPSKAIPGVVENLLIKMRKDSLIK